MPNGTYGGVRGRKTKVGRKLLRFPPTRFFALSPSLSKIYIHHLIGISIYTEKGHLLNRCPFH